MLAAVLRNGANILFNNCSTKYIVFVPVSVYMCVDLRQGEMTFHGFYPVTLYWHEYWPIALADVYKLGLYLEQLHSRLIFRSGDIVDLSHAADSRLTYSVFLV